MVPTALDELAQLCQIFCVDEASNPSYRNVNPTSSGMQPKKGNQVGIKNKKGVSYLQYQVKLAAAAVSLPKEPVSDPLSQRTSHLPFRDQIRLLKRKVWSLENNKDTTKELKRNNKDAIKFLNTKNQWMKIASKEWNLTMNSQKVAMEEEMQTIMREEI